MVLDSSVRKVEATAGPHTAAGARRAPVARAVALPADELAPPVQELSRLPPHPRGDEADQDLRASPVRSPFRDEKDTEARNP